MKKRGSADSSPEAWYSKELTAAIDKFLLLLKRVGSIRLGESDLHPISPKSSAPQYQPIRRKEEKEKVVEDIKEASSLDNLKSIGPALKTRQSQTIKSRATKIFPQRYWEGNKTTAVLRGSGARRRISITISEDIQGLLKFQAWVWGSWRNTIRPFFPRPVSLNIGLLWNISKLSLRNIFIWFIWSELETWYCF